jgi:thymidylate synthase (FAD)
MTQIKVHFIDSMGSDLTVVNAARVSFDKESTEFSEKDKKLIEYLAKHKHMSPFGHCFATFRVEAPVFVARQLVKHKFLRWNEVSRRYVDKEPEFYTPDKWYYRSHDLKQGRSDAEFEDITMGDYYLVAYNRYNSLIKSGVAPEMARMILPQSMMTEWYWSGSLDAFADMYNLRSKPDTQEESRQVANQINTHMSIAYPVSWKVLTRKCLLLTDGENHDIS